MKKNYLFLFSLFISAQLTAQEEQIEYLIDSLVRKHGVKELRIDLKSTNLNSDTTIWLESRYFDNRGNKSESLSPGSRGRFDRQLFRSDSLDHRTLYRNYDKQDTTKFYSETKWSYLDSNSYLREEFYEGKLTALTEYEMKETQDTLWLTENKYSHEYDKHYRKVSRYRSIGDSLQISEFIKFNDSLKLRDVDTYFKLKRDVDTGYLIIEGQYIIKMSEWEKFHKDKSLMRDFYQHPDKYIKMQLDGQFEYEYSDDPHTYKVYNYDNQLLQDGRGIYKSTFAYNDLGQLIKVIRWGEFEGERYAGVIEKGYVYYEYNARGFPIKVTEHSLARDTLKVYYYTYSF